MINDDFMADAYFVFLTGHRPRWRRPPPSPAIDDVYESMTKLSIRAQKAIHELPPGLSVAAIDEGTLRHLKNCGPATVNEIIMWARTVSDGETQPQQP